MHQYVSAPAKYHRSCIITTTCTTSASPIRISAGKIPSVPHIHYHMYNIYDNLYDYYRYSTICISASRIPSVLHACPGITTTTTTITATIIITVTTTTIATTATLTTTTSTFARNATNYVRQTLIFCYYALAFLSLSSYLLVREKDGRTVRCGIISSCQSDATSKIAERF